MKEYCLGIQTNVWNALRYSVITLGLVPLAEKLWSRLHSRRTGERVIHGRTARLRQSRLAHWGLHQEVDEESRLSRFSAIVVCLLHIAGAILIESGSGSAQTYVWKDTFVSPSLRDHGGLRPKEVYFLDAGYISDMPDGIYDCIDIGPRNLEDFGLRVAKIPAFRSFPYNQIPMPRRNVDLVVRYYTSNSGAYIEMYDNGTARWFEYSVWVAMNFRYRVTLGYINDSTACKYVNRYFFECSESYENTDFVSDALASVTVRGINAAYPLLRQSNWRVNLVMNSTSILSPDRLGLFLRRSSIRSRQDVRLAAEEDAQTEWVRRGLPRRGLPRRGLPREKMPRKEDMILQLNIIGLTYGCSQSLVMPGSNLRKIRGLKVSNPTFFRPTTGNYTSTGEYSLLVWLEGKKTRLGAVTQVSNGYCCDVEEFRLCVRRKSSRNHEVAQYIRETSRYSTYQYYTKYLNFSVEGELRGTDALDIAIQDSVEMTRIDRWERYTKRSRRSEKARRFHRTWQGTFRTCPSCWKTNAGKVSGGQGRNHYN